MRTLATLAAALLLTGCFSSTQPLFPEAAGGCPFAEPTQFGMSRIDRNGGVAAEPAFVIRAEGRLCVHVSPFGMQQRTRRFLAVRLAEDLYALQERQDDNQRYSYGLLQVRGERVDFYQPSCGDFTPEALQEAGVTAGFLMGGFWKTPAEEQTPDGSCALRSSDQVRKLFLQWKHLGRPADSQGVRMQGPPEAESLDAQSPEPAWAPPTTKVAPTG